MQKTCAVILAAGDGKRMKSRRPKVLCEVLFKPMISWVADSVSAAGIVDCCVVVSPEADAVRAVLPPEFHTAAQAERLGTGHAASMAADFLRTGSYTDVLVLYGDAPFFTSRDILEGLALHTAEGNAVTIYAAELAEPTGYGRIVRQNGAVSGIVEEKDADEETRKVKMVNAGTYWFQASFLLDFFGQMTCENTQGEYYLTDTLEYALSRGKLAGVHTVAPSHASAANSRRELAALNELARQTLLEEHLDRGVNIPFSDGIVIGPDVSIGIDTTILPGTILKGATVVGEGCELGPDTTLQNAKTGDGCRIVSSLIVDSELRDNVSVGPWTNIRPGCVVSSGVKIGDFVELKNSSIGANTSVAHLTYIGDSDVGARCNFGCGVVTANYDGKNKYRTVVGDGCFIGCNCNLVPPVTVGDNVYAATGTTITEDVPAEALVIGRVRQEVKPGWSRKSGLYQK